MSFLIAIQVLRCQIEQKIISSPDCERWMHTDNEIKCVYAQIYIVSIPFESHY